MLFKEWEEELAQVLLYWSMDLSEQEKVLILHIYGRIKGKKISFCFLILFLAYMLPITHSS